MVYLKSTHFTSAVAATAVPTSLKVGDASSVQGVSKTLAAGAMSYYSGNATVFQDLPAPYYWWECGALFGAMLDYSHYTKDTSYDDTIATALLAQVGPALDFMLPKHYGDEGNDDQMFWSFAVMAAAEQNFPQPPSSTPSWLQLGENIWNTVAARWNTTNCGGGFTWQIFASNPNGLNYKNSVSNGGFMQLSARLARATGNQTYLDWANKVWDWSTAIGMVDSSFNVYDGADSSNNCTQINPVSFSYSAGIYLYGAAVLANYTNDPTWANRAVGLMNAAESFFSPFDNATNVMWEHACEGVNRCNTDMKSFKGYLSRFMYKSAVMMPALLPAVNALLPTSATAAVNTCTGGTGGTTCGQKWYVGGFDGSVGLGQEMSALETVQGLLAGQAEPPLRAGEIQDVRGSAAPSTAAAAATSDTPAPSTSPTPTKRSNSAGNVELDLRWAALSLLTGVLVWGML